VQAAATLPKYKKRWSDRELLALPADGYKYEALDGALLMSPGTANHGWVCIRIASMLLTHVERHALGKVFDSSTGFRLSPSTLLCPDVSFVSVSRLSTVLISPDKFLQGAPDLAVEVLSPSDRPKIIEAKLDKYFEHGVRLAWLVDWKKQEVIVQTPLSTRKLIGLNAVLTGDDVLPKFKCDLSDVFGRA
jgi:Uma2 family endonuclease